MKEIKIFLFILLAVTLISCKEDKDNPEPMKSNKELIVGTWKYGNFYNPNGEVISGNNSSILNFNLTGQMTISNSGNTYSMTYWLSPDEDTLYYTNGGDTSIDILSFKDSNTMDWKDSNGYTNEWIRQ